jgi:hypothetical protein
MLYPSNSLGLTPDLHKNTKTCQGETQTFFPVITTTYKIVVVPPLDKHQNNPIYT